MIFLKKASCNLCILFISLACNKDVWRLNASPKKEEVDFQSNRPKRLKESKGEECTICYEELKDDTACLACGRHELHQLCLKNWLARQIQDKKLPDKNGRYLLHCPICAESAHPTDIHPFEAHEKIRELDADQEPSRESMEALKSILSKNKYHLDLLDPEGLTALIHAVNVGSRNVVSELKNFEHVLDINKKDTSGFSALVHAAYLGDAGIARELLTFKNIDVNQGDDEDNTPLMHAISCNSIDTVKELLKSSRDIGVRNNRGNTALLLALAKENTQIASLLLDHPGVDVNEVNHQGDTPLMMAVMAKNASFSGEVIKKLLASSNLNSTKKNKDGNTALDLARNAKRIDAIILLENKNFT